MTSAYEHGEVPPIEVRHRLRIARERAGLDQDQLAERMAVTRSTISNAEQGKGSPRRSTVNAWALATGVKASWLNTGVGSIHHGGTVDKPTDCEQAGSTPAGFSELRPTG